MLRIKIFLFNSLPNDKILVVTKFKAFADDNLKMVETVEFALNIEENIVGEGENAGYQHFLLLQQCFQNAAFLGLLKPQITW